jgi:hypothetical protein
MHGTALLCDLRVPRSQENRSGRATPLGALLAPYLRAWQRHGVRFGSRSWDGWSLEEYAALFSIALLEIGPRSFPSPSLLCRLRQSMPGDGRLSVSVTDDSLIYRFPYGHPDLQCRGERNERFLDPVALEDRVLGPLGELGDAVEVVILNIPRVYPTEGPVFGQVLSRLDRLLSGLPRRWRFAIALHNGGYLLPDYLACLRDHGVGHVLRCGEEMPPLLEQLQMPGAFHAGPIVVDVPAGGMQEEMLLGIAEAIRRALEENRPLAVYAGDRPEESTLAFLLALMTLLNPDLAKRSVLRRCAA